jgi:hypothetical protein
MEDFIYMIGELYVENRRLRQSVADLAREVQNGKEEIERWKEAEAGFRGEVPQVVPETWQEEGSAQPTRTGGVDRTQEVRQEADGEDGGERTLA